MILTTDVFKRRAIVPRAWSLTPTQRNYSNLLSKTIVRLQIKTPRKSSKKRLDDMQVAEDLQAEEISF